MLCRSFYTNVYSQDQIPSGSVIVLVPNRSGHPLAAVETYRQVVLMNN